MPELRDDPRRDVWEKRLPSNLGLGPALGRH
jgi:hypothetical protein